MDKRLSRFVAGLLIIISTVSSIVWVSAEEAATVSAEDLSHYKTLTLGYTGPEVAALKQRMFELGYFRTNTVNESFTTNTAEYVRKFEEINGLPVDGIADPEMQALFFSDNAQKADGTLMVPEKTAEQVPELLIGRAEEDEINQRFRDFLDGVGDFIEEQIELMRHSLKSPGMPLRDLGFFEGMDDRAEIQGILLAHFQFDDSELLAIGTKDRKGNRRVTLVEWPTIQQMKIPNRKCSFEMISGNSFSSKILQSQEDILKFLEWKTGSVILCTFIIKYDMNRIPVAETELRAYVEMFIANKDLNLDYVSSLLFPKRNTLRKWELRYYDRKAMMKLPEIHSVQDIQEYLKGAPALPITPFLSVYGSDYALPDWLKESNQ